MKHLIYHVAPLEANNIWVMNLRQLLRRSFRVFTGRRVIAVAQGPGCVSTEHVKQALSDYSLGDEQWEILELPNDKKLREVITFLPLLRSVLNESGYVFYAHTKGNSTVDGVPGATRWRNTMYHHLLDRDTECIEIMKSGASMVGCCQMQWSPVKARDAQQVPRPTLRRTPFPSRLENTHQWIFAGTFYWFRLDRVAHNPRRFVVPADRYAVEAWPGQMFTAESCYSMWNPFHPRHAMSPYDPKWYEAKYDDNAS